MLVYIRKLLIACIVILCIVPIADNIAFADIFTQGDCTPPFEIYGPSTTYTTTSYLYVGYSYKGGWLTASDDSILTSNDTVCIGNHTDSVGYATFNSASWISNDHVYVGNLASIGYVFLNEGSSWTANANTYIGHTDNSRANVFVDSNSTWTLNSDLEVGTGQNSYSKISITEGTLNSGNTTLGKDISGSRAFVYINNGGVMNNTDSLNVELGHGHIIMDGGTLSLSGQNNIAGELAALSESSIILNFGALYGEDYGVTTLGSEVDLTNVNILIAWASGFTADRLESYNVFDIYDEVELEALLSSATSITTPEGWMLDYTTGILTLAPVPEPSLAALVAIGGLAALFRRKKRKH